MNLKKQFSAPPRRVALFVTCMVDLIYPAVGLATVELLERHGVEVIFPEEQTCCGQPAYTAGYQDEARQLAERFLDIFEPLVNSGQVDAIVVPSGSCATMTTHYYAALYDKASTSSFYHRAQSLAAVTFELTEFLVDVLHIDALGAQLHGKITYHACCQLLRDLAIDRQPRTLLDHVEDAEIVPLAGAEECCGFGGLFAIQNAGISTAMGQRKTRNIADSDADLVAMCDVSCMAHINGLLQRQSQRCRAIHIAEILNNQVDVEARTTQQANTAPPPAPRRWKES